MKNYDSLSCYLPKPYRFSIVEFFNYTAGFASIVSLICAAFFIDKNNIALIFYLSFLFIVVVALIINNLIYNSRKLHRYAQATIFTHYINHVIRDSLVEISRSDKSSIDALVKSTIIKIINAVSNCFSIITARRCRACIIEIKPDELLNVAARDRISHDDEARKKKANSNRHRSLSNNSDFSDLWYGRCRRYFLSNNLVKLWQIHSYKNSSLEEFGQPDVFNFFGIQMVRNWTLPYRASIILPIRYIKEFNPPSTFGNSPEWHYYGFLCIDSNSKHCFEERFSPELGATFADAIYSYLHQIEEIKIYKK